MRLRPAKTEEITPEAQVGLLGAYVSVGKRNWWNRLWWRTPCPLSLELWSIEQKTHFYLSVPKAWGAYFSSLVVSHYPKTFLEETTDPAIVVVKEPYIKGGVVRQTSHFAFPIKTFKAQTAEMMITSLVGTLAKVNEGETAGIQLLLRVPDQNSLHRQVRKMMQTKDAEGHEVKSTDAPMYEHKLTSPFIEAQLRVVYGSQSAEEASKRAQELAGAFGSYALAQGNTLVYKQAKNQNLSRLTQSLVKRQFTFGQPLLVLNTEEAASLWHLSDMSMGHIKNIDWGRTLLSEAPDNLPVAEAADETARREINFFGKTEWRNHETIFGLQSEDRRKHVYIMGKTGAGKSTLIANMAINDIRNGKGVAVIDPHGDLSEMILQYIPKRRINDVIYLDPTLAEDRAFSLNLFDGEGMEHTDVVASGIISVFYKLYHNSWGPRLEYILRNAILTLLYTKEATFADIITLLTQKNYREKILATIQDKDPVIAAFWRDEFDAMPPKLRVEAISPILNKVGQFLSSQRIRHVVDSPKSTFSLTEVMDQGKILIMNLAQGKLGEDTTALLGAMFITKMQLTAMRRVNQPEAMRRDFYLYVDEFQNFATQSFIKILSESRKYRLNLIMANQYIDQVEETIASAIFGNIGTLITFVVGARDAAMLTKEFGQKFTEQELVGLGKYQILMKMSVGGLTGEPFFALTLPLPAVVNDNRDKIIQVSLERYYRKSTS